ncbi:MAG TPA: glyceraldehyde 3-phosphate dehydrogenase NAD-binding domain-containing protein, partial [Thermoanaerobaculia bacterium]|nr:glyceraldehyde 3-phosphate dehydrogenase NAD-binding domain-containing protein [Thermoanaerobaculia bacterium]
MSLPFAITGLGRIGRALLRIARERPELELVAVNDLGSAAQLAPLIAHDSVHGRFKGEVHAEGEALVLDGRRIPVTAIAEPSALDWGATNPRVVVDATGHCKSR